MHQLILSDPVTTSWLLALLLLFLVVVAIPLVRLALAGAIYAVAALTGRHHLRPIAARMMPKLGHLLGSIVVGVASVAAPVSAAPHAEPRALSIDRDGGAATTVSSATDTTDPASRPATSTTQPSEEPRLYVVKSGDSLWSIAESRQPDATNIEITETWKAIWRANRRTIGDHPERIKPGMTLDLQDVVS